MNIKFSKLIKNDGSETFRQSVMDYCLNTKVMPIHISKDYVAKLVKDQSLTVIYEKGCSLEEITNKLLLHKKCFSECILKMAYIKYNPNNRPTIEDIEDRNGLIELFANTKNPIWGLAADESVETKLEILIAYNKQSDYDIISIKNFKDFEPFRRYNIDWWFSDSEAIFNVYMENGKNRLYLLKRKNIGRLRRKEGENHPKDKYGLSLIAVFVSGQGDIFSIIPRWVTLEDIDQLMTKSELKELLGSDFTKLK